MTKINLADGWNNRQSELYNALKQLRQEITDLIREDNRKNNPTGQGGGSESVRMAYKIGVKLDVILYEPMYRFLIDDRKYEPREAAMICSTCDYILENPYWQSSMDELADHIIEIYNKEMEIQW